MWIYSNYQENHSNSRHATFSANNSCKQKNRRVDSRQNCWNRHRRQTRHHRLRGRQMVVDIAGEAHRLQLWLWRFDLSALYSLPLVLYFKVERRRQFNKKRKNNYVCMYVIPNSSFLFCSSSSVASLAKNSGSSNNVTSWFAFITCNNIANFVCVRVQLLLGWCFLPTPSPSSLAADLRVSPRCSFKPVRMLWLRCVFWCLRAAKPKLRLSQHLLPVCKNSKTYKT